MPDGLVFSGDDTQLLNALRERFDAHSDGAAPEMLVTSGVPDRTATHVVITGPLTDEVDALGPGGPAADAGGRAMAACRPGRVRGRVRLVAAAPPDPHHPAE